jgi:outer membrane protein assembly factor BamA
MQKKLIFFLLAGWLAAFTAFGQDEAIPDSVAAAPGRFLLFPFFLKSPETNWGFGGATAYFFRPEKKDTLIRTSDVNFVGLYTLNKQVVLVLNSTVFFPEENQIFRFQGSYSYYPDKFWGKGNETPPDNEEDYSLKQYFINPQLLYRVYSRLYAGLNYEYQNTYDVRYAPGSIFDTQQIPGRYGGKTSGLGLLVTWDTRNNAFSPSKGFFSEINFTSFARVLGSDFSFTSLVVDMRKFIRLRLGTVLALRGFGKLSQGDVPFRNLAMLGGSELMRGYYKGRYADEDLLALQAEVRQFLFWRLGAAVFGSAGQVSNETAGFRLNDFHYAYGAGLRFLLNEKEKLNLRVDYGRSDDGGAVYVILKEAF